MSDHLLRFAKAMRHTPTDAESAVWRQLRRKNLAGAKFKRQQTIGRYIVDFVCLERRLIIEIDGGQHDATVDLVRSRWLQAQGFTLLRFWNNDVLLNPDGVFETISRALRDNPSPQPLSRKGRGAKAKQSGEGLNETSSRALRDNPSPSPAKGEGLKQSTNRKTALAPPP